MKHYFPIFLDLVRRSVLVVGGGEVATHKVGLLLEAQAHVTVVAPEADDRIKDWAHRGHLSWKARPFEENDLTGILFVIAATNDKRVNARIFQLAEGRNMPANSVDDVDNCNFILGAVTQVGPIQVAVSSSGTSPTLAGRLRDEITADLLERKVDQLALFLGRWRAHLNQALPNMQVKRRFWARVLDSSIPAWLASGHEERASQHLKILIAEEGYALAATAD